MRRFSSVLLLRKQVFEPEQLLLHVLVNSQVSCHNHLHFLDVVVDIAVLGILSLNVLNEFALLSYHMSHFLQILQVI